MAKFFKCANGGFVNCELVTWAGVHKTDPCTLVFTYQGEDEYTLQTFKTPEEAEAELIRFIEFSKYG